VIEAQSFPIKEPHDHLHINHERMGWRLSAGRLKGLTLIASADLPLFYKGSGDCC
jgi:hypothetical protein